MSDISVLNAMIGCHNIVDSKKISEIMDGTLTTIQDVLKQHCGPYGKLAMIPPDVTNPLAEPTFTKDGINIVNAIECINDVEKVTKSLISYIGSRVERRAGDGTTTSMLLSINLLKQLRKLVDSKQIDYNEFVKLYDDATYNILSVYKSKYELLSTNYNTVMRQAFTSSHGDIKLARMVADLLADAPKELRDNLMFVRSRKETDEVYSIVTNDSSYSTQANVFDTRMYNSIVGNGVEVTDGTLIVTSTSLHSNSPEYLALKERLSKLTPEDKTVVVVTGMALDNRVTGELLEIHENKRREGVRFYIFRVQDNHPKINALNGLFAALEKDRDAMMDQSVECSFDSINYTDEILYIYSEDMLDYDELGLCIGHDDTDTPVGKLLEMCKNYIESSATIVEQAIGLSGTLDIARWILSTLKYKEYQYFVIGGKGYDNRAAIDVLTDVLKSSRSALDDGVSYAGLVGVTNAAYEVFADMKKQGNKSDYKYRLCKAILTAVLDTRMVILTTSKTMTKRVAGKYLYEHIELKENDLNIVTTETIASVEETFKRFGEVAIRYLFTSNVLIPNGVFVPEEKLNK